MGGTGFTIEGGPLSERRDAACVTSTHGCTRPTPMLPRRRFSHTREGRPRPRLLGPLVTMKDGICLTLSALPSPTHIWCSANERQPSRRTEPGSLRSPAQGCPGLDCLNYKAGIKMPISCRCLFVHSLIHSFMHSFPKHLQVQVFISSCCWNKRSDT